MTKLSLSGADIDLLVHKATALHQYGVYLRSGRACLMVQVGDLGVELPLNEMDCLSLGKHLITAAETMIYSDRRVSVAR
jgi:hypothetical protein